MGSKSLALLPGGACNQGPGITRAILNETSCRQAGVARKSARPRPVKWSSVWKPGIDIRSTTQALLCAVSFNRFASEHWWCFFVASQFFRRSRRIFWSTRLESSPTGAAYQAKGRLISNSMQVDHQHQALLTPQVVLRCLPVTKSASGPGNALQANGYLAQIRKLLDYVTKERSSRKALLP